MFSSPAVHIFSHENSSAVMKKALNNGIQRKPFTDIAVNSKTPMKSPGSKNNLLHLKKLGAPEPIISKQEGICISDFISTFNEKENDNFSDIWPQFNNASNERVISTLKNFCNFRTSTPPPELNTSEFDFFPEPELLAPMNDLMEDFSFKEYEVDSVDMPTYFDKFNDSI